MNNKELWKEIVAKRLFDLDELEYYKREVIYKRKVIKDQQEEIERLNEELGDANYTITQLHKVMDRHYVKKEDYDRLNNIINELEKDIQKEIERTNNLILEDSSMVEINNIRRMLNETRQCILFKLKKLKEGK